MLQTQSTPLTPVITFALLPIVDRLIVDVPRLVALDDNATKKLLIFLIGNVFLQSFGLGFGIGFAVPITGFFNFKYTDPAIGELYEIIRIERVDTTGIFILNAKIILTTFFI